MQNKMPGIMFSGGDHATAQLNLFERQSASATAAQYYFSLEWPQGTPERVKAQGNYARHYLITEHYHSSDQTVVKTAHKPITLSPGQSTEPLLLTAMAFDKTRSGLAWVGDLCRWR